MISKKAKYALKALRILGQNFDSRSLLLINDIATQDNIPKKFLETILLELKNKGILRSGIGRNGGYALAISPEQITIAQIIRIIDGPIAPTLCVSLYFYGKCDDCPSEEACKIRPIMMRVRDANLAVYEKTTLFDLIKEE